MPQSYDNFIKLATASSSKELANFSSLKKKISKELGISIPRNPDLRETYEEMVSDGKLIRDPRLEKALFSKRVRTQSGVAVVAVLTKEYPCPGKCIYCPTEKDMPKSYLSNEPAVMRAIASKFDPYLQVQSRLRALELNGHPIDKIELIVMGGTFSYLPKTYQRWFVTECFRACNSHSKNRNAIICHSRESGNLVSKSQVSLLDPRIREDDRSSSILLSEQKKNEKARCRIIGLTLETRPDYINKKEIINFRELGCTRVELGVQSIFDDVLEINKRGHDTKKTIEATRLLKNAGFKINYHMMPGLPGSTLEKDLEMFQKLFSNSDYQPDMLKIYPTVVLENSALYNLWKSKEYQPLSDESFRKLAVEIKNETIPPYARISRLVRDIPETSIIAGPRISNLRQLIEKESHCQCIRCREVRSDYSTDEKIILNRIDYDASGGKEIFLQFISPDKKKLFALLRLRITADSAIIREVHTYGKLTGVSKKDKDSPQHIGLGKKLLAEAEKIAKIEFGAKKIAVISGVGVRGYYRKFGYRLRDTYMVKKL